MRTVATCYVNKVMNVYITTATYFNTIVLFRAWYCYSYVYVYMIVKFILHALLYSFLLLTDPRKVPF